MVNIANSSAKLISTTVNEKSGTTIKKFLMPEYGRKAMATVVEYGENNPLKKKGIDSFVKSQELHMLVAQLQTKHYSAVIK